MLLASTALLFAFLISSPISIETIREDPEGFRDQKLIVCGEPSKDGGILYSNTVLKFHGRVGIRISGFKIADKRNETCLTGKWIRDPELPYATASHITLTDAGVHPYYVLEAFDSRG